MFTSFFDNIANVRTPLSISGRAPEWYRGPQFRVLAPKLAFFTEYKEGRLGEDGYEREFRRLVLGPLDPAEVYGRLVREHGSDVTLLCYERPGLFCHRRLVARWFEESLGVVVPELPAP